MAGRDIPLVTCQYRVSTVPVFCLCYSLLCNTNNSNLGTGLVRLGIHREEIIKSSGRLTLPLVHVRVRVFVREREREREREIKREERYREKRSQCN